MTAAGHLSSAFIIKSKFKEIPFWILLLASEAVELVWVILNLNLISLSEPIEAMKINSPFQYIGDMILFQQIVSHSFVGALLIALIFALFFKVWKRINGIFLAVFLGVFGHWCLDLIVHDADLPVFISLSSLKLGPLLNFDSFHPEQGFYSTAPIFGFCFQTLFSFFAAFTYLKSFSIVDTRKKKKFWTLVALVNFSILGIFLKGVMTWLITSSKMMVIMVFVDILISGIMLYAAVRLVEPENI